MFQRYSTSCIFTPINFLQQTEIFKHLHAICFSEDCGVGDWVVGIGIISFFVRSQPQSVAFNLCLFHSFIGKEARIPCNPAVSGACINCNNFLKIFQVFSKILWNKTKLSGIAKSKRTNESKKLLTLRIPKTFIYLLFQCLVLINKYCDIDWMKMLSYE